jgi:hypothetical protein
MECTVPLLQAEKLEVVVAQRAQSMEAARAAELELSQHKQELTQHKQELTQHKAFVERNEKRLRETYEGRLAEKDKARQALVHKVGAESTPSEHESTPCGHASIPSGQEFTPYGHESTPSGHESTSSGHESAHSAHESAPCEPYHSAPRSPSCLSSCWLGFL